MLGYRAWRRQFCPGCSQRHTDLFDADGIELKDPLVHVVEAVCPGCEMLADARAEQGDGDGRKGSHLYFERYVDDEPEAAADD